MDQRNFIPAQEHGAYSRPGARSCFLSVLETISSGSEAFEYWPQQLGPAPVYEAGDEAPFQESSRCSNQYLYQDDDSHGQRAEHITSSGYYDNTGRRQSYRNNTDIGEHNR